MATSRIVHNIVRHVTETAAVAKLGTIAHQSRGAMEHNYSPHGLRYGLEEKKRMAQTTVDDLNKDGKITPNERKPKASNKGRRRRRGRGGGGGGSPSSKGATQPVAGGGVFMPHQLVQSRGLHDEFKGVDHVQSFALHGTPVMYQKRVPGTYVDVGRFLTDYPIGSDAAGADQATDVYGSWYEPKLDRSMAAALFRKLRFNVKGRIKYGPYHVEFYLAFIANMLERYYSLVSWMTVVDGPIGYLNETREAIEKMYPAIFGREADGTRSDGIYDISDTKAYIDLFRRSMAGLPFPPAWITHIKRLYGPRKHNSHPDTPIIGFCATDRRLNKERFNKFPGKTLAQYNALGTAAKATELGKVVVPVFDGPAGITHLIEDFDWIHNHVDLMKLAADLESSLGWALSDLGEGQGLGEDAMISELWRNNAFGRVYADNAVGADDADLVADISIAPATSSPGNSENTEVMYQFENEPDEFFLAYHTQTMDAKDVNSIRGPSLFNFPMSHGNHADIVEKMMKKSVNLGLFYFGNAPDKAPGVYKIMDPASQATAESGYRPATVHGREDAWSSVFRRAELGWMHCTHTADGNVDGDDWQAGYRPTNPLMGTRKWTTAFRMYMKANDIWRTILGV